MNRREALKFGVGAALGCAMDGLAMNRDSMPIIDSHIHLFDTSRPGGVPWPEKTDVAIYKPALPDRYARIAEPLGVVGAIAIEASPLKSDNDWVLRQAADHPILVGFIGDLIPGTPSFPRDLDRLRQNPIFLGIRYGNLWNRDLLTDLKKPGFLEDVRRLAAEGLTMDSANPDPALIRAILEVSQSVPELRIVIDHLPNATLPNDAGVLKEYRANLQKLAQNSAIYMKLSEIPERHGSRVPADVGFYQHKLDVLWDIFGEDHILYGSDWPNSDHLLSYAATLRIARGYAEEKGKAATEKVFWKNSIAAYRWRPRRADQRNL